MVDKKVIEFVSTCIENYKMKYHLKGTDVMALFDRYGVTEFLIDGYEVLHTQAIQYSIEEIELFLEHRGYVS